MAASLHLKPVKFDKPFLGIDDQVHLLEFRGFGVDADTGPTLMFKVNYLILRWCPVRLRLRTSAQSKKNETGTLLVLLMHVEGVPFPYVRGGLRVGSCRLECICLQV